MKKLRVNPLVVADLSSIRDYIAEDNIRAAKETIERIYSCFEYLQQFPEIGTNLSKRVSFKTNHKYLIHRNYIIIYLLEDEWVEIYRVIDRRQDVTGILFK